MNPNVEDGRFAWHSIFGDQLKRLLSIDEIFPHVALESHSLEDEATSGQEALVKVDRRHNEPTNGAENGDYSNKDEQ